MKTKGHAGEIDRELGKRVRALRLARGVSQSDLADALGVSYQQLQKNETGANRISAARLYEIAAFFNISMDIFFPSTTPDATPYQYALLSDEALSAAMLLDKLPADIRAHMIAVIKTIRR